MTVCWMRLEDHALTKEITRISGLDFSGISDLADAISGTSGWIAGGAVVDTLLGRRPRDLDMYFQNEWDMFTVAWRHVNLGAKCEAWSDKLIRIITYDNVSVDLIQERFSSAGDILDDFDIGVCCAAVSWSPRRVYFDTDWFEDIASKRIRFKRIEHPFKALMRSNKYAAKRFPGMEGDGFQMTESDAVRLAEALRDQDGDFSYGADYS